MARLNAHPLKSLMLVCAHQTLLGVGGRSIDTEPSSEANRFRFAVGAVRYALALEPIDGHPDQTWRRMMARFGRLPFSAEDPSGRAALKSLLRLTQDPPGFRLAVGEGQTLWALHDERIGADAPPARLLHDVFRFVHVTLPFARMFSPYLR